MVDVAPEPHSVTWRQRQHVTPKQTLYPIWCNNPKYHYLGNILQQYLYKFTLK